MVKINYFDNVVWKFVAGLTGFEERVWEFIQASCVDLQEKEGLGSYLDVDTFLLECVC